MNKVLLFSTPGEIVTDMPDKASCHTALCAFYGVYDPDITLAEWQKVECHPEHNEAAYMTHRGMRHKVLFKFYSDGSHEIEVVK